MRSILVVMLLTCLGAQAWSLPPWEGGRGFVAGANHHLGDAGFVAHFGRMPGSGASDALRMRLHLEHVRALLGATPPTRPALAARRAELLGYLDDYIAKGVTPRNLDRPWRTPVFVDALGNVCAVGYLIERSVGRALVERVAARHRFDFLEDIAMPEVSAWVAGSGFTLTELASIQPGYEAPIIETWQVWDVGTQPPADGRWEVEVGGVTTRGSWRGGQMEGRWTRMNADGGVIGAGDFAAGRGSWTSYDRAGRTIARGPIRKSVPAGSWRFFHASGRVAAEGTMVAGQRFGVWSFYYDAEGAWPVARGRFARGGRVTGRWRHFDPAGALLATTWQEASDDGDEVLRLRVSEREGLRRDIAQGTFGGDYHRVDALERGGLRLYVAEGGSVERTLHDGTGQALRKVGGRWHVQSCGWDRRLGAGDVGQVRELLFERWRSDAVPDACAPEVPLDPERAAEVEAMLALADRDEPMPELMRAYLPEDEEVPRGGLTRILAETMTWYVEWPHIDGAFARVFETLPGHYGPGALAEAIVAEAPDGVTRLSSKGGLVVVFR